MQQIFAKCIMLKSGWAENVLLDIDCNGLIQQIKPDTAIDSSFKGQLIDGPLVPGMVNNHSHAFQWAMAGLAEQSGQGSDSFWSWRKLMYDFVGKITPDDLNAIASALYMQMLKAGYTSVGEFHYLHHDFKGQQYSDIGEMSAQISRAATDVGIGLTLLPVFYRYAGFGKQAPNAGQARFINDHQSYDDLLARVSQIVSIDSNQNFGIAPHSLRAVDKTDINWAIESLNEFNTEAPIHIHIAEQLKEVEDCQNHYGMRPVAWLADNFELNERWCLVHATHMEQAEIEAVANAKSVVSICTTTEGNLGDGHFPMLSYTKHQGVWSIGSDSHISLSASEELRWLEYQNRLLQHSRTLLTAGDYSSNGHWLWSQASRGGSQSLNRKSGELCIGSRADFVELNTEDLSLYNKTENQLLDSLIFNQQSGCAIKSVWVGAEMVIKDNKHPRQENIEASYKQVLKKLVKSL